MTYTKKRWFYYAVFLCTRQRLSALARGGLSDARRYLLFQTVPPFLLTALSLPRKIICDKT
ncbi:hypothetical protein [Bacillus pumilus]|uniref:hypothetical protein n=1 Tax=Bacillus pumilus TaxID=1408 RepID=UPI0011A35055|nr:hypothetical protein [Bacillus pumilus]